MMAVKATIKDRWRKIISEANRVECKHFMMLQEGIGSSIERGDRRKSYIFPAQVNNKEIPGSGHPYMQAVEYFIGDMRLLRVWHCWLLDGYL